MCDGSGPQITRRALMATSARIVAAGATTGLGQVVNAAAAPRPVVSGANGRTKVFLLGSQGGQQRTQLTGGKFRAGTAILIVIDGVGYLVDAGVGALLRLNEAGFDANVVRHVFMTHHHQDHNADLGVIMGFAWTSGRSVGNPDRRMDVWGPPGTNAYVKGYQASLALNISDQQVHLGQRPPFHKFLHHHEFPLHGRVVTHPVTVMHDERVHVSAIRVNHGSMPSVGYRFRTPDLDIAFSGDRGTRGDHLDRLVHQPDVLFHEISDITLVAAVLRQQHQPPSFIDHQLHDHSPPSLVATTANAAQAKQLVLYHLIPGNIALSDAHWESLLRPTYPGPITVGKDLLEL